MKAIQLLVPIAACLVLNACRVDLVDGKIPAKYISVAQEKAGHYAGTFEGKPAELILNINNDGSAELNFDNDNGDIVGADCKSVIGDLNALWASSKKAGGASFKLQTACKVLGKTVDLDFNKNEKLSVRVVKDSYQTVEQNCHSTERCDSKGECRSGPEVCIPRTVTNYTYFSGKFQKSK